LVQLQNDLETIGATGTQVVAISYDPVATLRKFAEEKGITYTLLSDAGSKTIDAYGIRNKEVAGHRLMDGVPYPGTYLLDKDGVVRAKFFLERYQERHSNAELIEAARALP